METERARFAIEAQHSGLSHSELCRRHGISRPTGHKWIERYQAEGLAGLGDRSHRPHACPHATSQAVVDRILKIRDKREWGARKIQKKLVEQLGEDRAPSKDTVQRILHRNGRIEPGKPRRRRTHPDLPLPIKPESNATWTADFKGEFRTQDRRLCYPLTVQDGHSRYLLECRGMDRIAWLPTKRRFTWLFREFGLPEKIRTDNGAPFSSRALAGLSHLSIWWISLGIHPERIQPGKPQQNGRHERMHRTLKKRTASPPKGNMRAQQYRFDQFRRTYNQERPHEALNMETPASVYRPSPRPYPEKTEPLNYPGHFEIRRVAVDSTIRWNNRKVFVTSTLRRQHIGLEQVSDRVWSVYFGPIHMGWLDEADYRIMDVKNRKSRRR